MLLQLKLQIVSVSACAHAHGNNNWHDPGNLPQIWQVGNALALLEAKACH